LPTAGNRVIFHVTSFKTPFAIKAVMDAAKAPYEKTGFDPSVAIGAQVNLHIAIKDDPTYGIKNIITKIWAV